MNNHLETHADSFKVRQPDPPLTDLGHQQAAKLAAWLASEWPQERITHVFSSLMTRAVQTAAPIAKALALPVLGLTQAHECGGLSSGPQGNFAPVCGKTHASMLEDCPALVWPDELTGQAWPGGYEPWEQAHFQARARAVAEQLRAAAHDAELMVLVTHHDFAQFLLAELLGLPALDGEKLTFHLANTSTTCIRGRTIQDGTQQRFLQWLNRLDHLPAELVSG